MSKELIAFGGIEIKKRKFRRCVNLLARLSIISWSYHTKTNMKSKKITTNLTNPYSIFILFYFYFCFLSPLSSFNDEKIKAHVLQ